MKTKPNQRTTRRPTRHAAQNGPQTRAPQTARTTGGRPYTDFFAMCLYPGMSLDPVAPERIPAA